MRILEVYKTTGKSIQYFLDKGNIKLYDNDMFFHINIKPDREKLYNKCEIRFKKFIEEDDAIKEIETFAKNNIKIVDNLSKYTISSTIGFKEGLEFLNNKITMEEFINKSIQNTKRYAKRQYTWFNNQFDNFDLIIT